MARVVASDSVSALSEVARHHYSWSQSLGARILPDRYSYISPYCKGFMILKMYYSIFQYCFDNHHHSLKSCIHQISEALALMPFVWCLIINQSTKVSFCLLWFTLLSHYCHTTVTTDGCSSSTSFGKSYVDMKSSIESSIHTICGMEQSHKFDLICNSLGGLHLFNIILYISNELRWRLTYFKFLSFAKKHELFVWTIQQIYARESTGMYS